MKEQIKRELINYQAYIKKHFQSSPLSSKKDSVEFYNLFEEVLTLSKIIQRISNPSNTQVYCELIEYNLNNILYFLPLNETISINVSVRNTVEATLKLINTLDEPQKNFYGTGYRTMKDSRKELTIYNENKNIIDNLFNIYAQRSNNIHLKNAHDIELVSVLESKYLNEIDRTFLTRISTDITNCKHAILETVVFYKLELNTHQKISLKNYLSRKWQKKFNELP